MSEAQLRHASKKELPSWRWTHSESDLVSGNEQRAYRDARGPGPPEDVRIDEQDGDDDDEDDLPFGGGAPEAGGAGPPPEPPEEGGGPGGAEEPGGEEHPEPGAGQPEGVAPLPAAEVVDVP